MNVAIGIVVVIIILWLVIYTASMVQDPSFFN